MDANKLNALDALFNEAKDVVVEDSYPTLPDGVYVGKITELKLGDTKAGKPVVNVTLKEKESGIQKRLSLFLTANDNSKEGNQKAMARARMALVKLGADENVSSFMELVQSAQDNAVNSTIKYELKTREGSTYQNVNQFNFEILEKATEVTQDTTNPFGGNTEVDISDDNFPF